MNSSWFRLSVSRLAALLGLIIVVVFAMVSGVSADPSAPVIVGGQEADPGEWPWQVALVRKGVTPYFGQFCGGSIIHRNWILTAAHCVETSEANDLDIIVGIHDLANPEPDIVRMAISQIVIHPGWNSNNNDNDIALLKLTGSIPARAGSGGTLPIAFANLAPAFIGNLTGTMSTVTGWGNRDPNGNDFPERLHEVEVPIISNAECSGSYGNLTDNMICAGYPQGGKDSCQGDSGGPLVIYDNTAQRWVQVGIVSFGVGCARPEYPGVYTRVSRYASWINSYINPAQFTNNFFVPLVAYQPYVPPSTLLENGNFEQGPGTGWTEFSSNGYPLITNDFGSNSIIAHSGQWAAWLGGLADELSVLGQDVTIQPGKTVLVYYYWIGSEDACGYDFAYVTVESVAVKTYNLCNASNTGAWVRGTADLGAYNGRTVLVQFVVQTDESGNSNFFVDDVSLTSSLAASEPEPPGRAPSEGTAAGKQ